MILYAILRFIGSTVHCNVQIRKAVIPVAMLCVFLIPVAMLCVFLIPAAMLCVFLIPVAILCVFTGCTCESPS